MQLILTGALGVGKSTVVQQVLAGFSGQVGGYLTRKIYMDGQLSGLEICSFSGECRLFGRPTVLPPKQFNDWQVDVGLFDRFAGPLLQAARAQADLLVIDELGILEADALEFTDQVSQCFSAKKPLLAVIQQRALGFWQAQLPVLPEIWPVTKANRSYLAPKILAHLFLTGSTG